MSGIDKLLMESIASQEVRFLTGFSFRVWSRQVAEDHAATEGLPPNLNCLIRETYNWFTLSTVGEARFKELYTLTNDGLAPSTLLQLSQTRWMTSDAAIVRILHQWIKPKLILKLLEQKEICYTAELTASVLRQDELCFFYF